MFLVQVLLKPSLKEFEHYLASMWNECKCVWTFVGIALLWNWNELAPRPGPTNQAPVLSAKQLTGWEHNPTHQQTGCLKTSWAHSHLHTHPLTWPCLLEAQDPAPFTSGQAPAPPTRKPAQVSGPVTPTTRSKKTMILQPAELNLQMQVRIYPGTSWSLALGWWEVTNMKSPTEGTSPRSTNINNLPYT